jgi:hypothetical protein
VVIKPNYKQWGEFFRYFHSTFMSGCRVKPGDWDYVSWKPKFWTEEMSLEWLDKHDPHRKKS